MRQKKRSEARPGAEVVAHRSGLWAAVGPVLMAIGLAAIVAPITVLETASSPHPSIWSNTAFLICLVFGGLALAAGAWILVAFFLPLPLPKTRREREAFQESAERVAREQIRSAAPPPPLAVPPSPPPDQANVAPQLVFDEAPPELANMSPAFLTELFAGRTDAQGAKLTEQHVGKLVRVSGEVTKVELATVNSVTIRAAVTMILFFDDAAAEQLLALNLGDKVVVSGQIHGLSDGFIGLTKCKLVEARGRVA